MRARCGFLFIATLLVIVGGGLSCTAQVGERTRIPTGGFRIAGKAVSATTGSPLAQAHIVISDTKNRSATQSVVTSEEGTFEFFVNAGKYSLQASKRGFIPTAYEQHDPQFSPAIVAGTGLDTENLILRVVPAATLSGVVLDEAGEPIRHANVTLFRENFWGGFGRIRQMRQDETDDRGGFEFGPINAGTYFLMASTKPWYAVHPASTKAGDPPNVVDPSLDVVYSPTYYGDTTESDDATPIPVRGGDRIQTEIHLTPVQALRILFRTPTDRSGFNMPMLM